MTPQKLICQGCKDEVLKVIVENIEKNETEVLRLAISSTSDSKIMHLARQLILIGAKSSKYQVGNMYVKKE